MRGDRVVAGGDLEIEPGGEQVLGQDLAHAGGNGEDERDAGDRAVLDALRAGGADRRQAPCLEVEDRSALRAPHQRLRATAGGEADLDPARGVRRGEERLRPRCVVAVGEDRLGAVDGERLRVGHETANRKLEVSSLLDRALRHHARPAGLRADEQRDRVQRRVARDPHRSLHLGEAAGCSLGGVGGEQRRVLLEVRDMRLVARHPAGA